MTKFGSRDITAILFDKDGTLFDFGASWNAWGKSVLTRLSHGDEGVARRLGGKIGFDFCAGLFQPDSFVIAGTPDELVDTLAPECPHLTSDALLSIINAEAEATPMIEAVPLDPLLDRLHAAGLRLGVATNDAEAPTLAHLGAAGVTDRFDFIAGSDSGYGAKPEPGQLLGFCDALGMDPAGVLMIGDSTHDLIAGRAAGMGCVAVLTGPATASDLAPFADVVLPDIGHLPELLGLG